MMQQAASHVINRKARMKWTASGKARTKYAVSHVSYRKVKWTARANHVTCKAGNQQESKGDVDCKSHES